MMINSILISTQVSIVSTQVNKSQRESDTSKHESTRYKSTRVNTNQHGSDMSEHEFDTSQHESKTNIDHRKYNNMAKQNPNVSFLWCFLEIYVGDSICQGFKFFSPICFQLNHQVLIFYRSIYCKAPRYCNA